MFLNVFRYFIFNESDIFLLKVVIFGIIEKKSLECYCNEVQSHFLQLNLDKLKILTEELFSSK